MNFLTDKISSLFIKYLTAAFGSALITSIYGVVDAAMVGNYQGPNGTAALAVVAPVWNIIYSLGLLTGIGGSVIFSTIRGASIENKNNSNEYFTSSVILTVILVSLTWIMMIFFDKQLLTFFGANDILLIYAQKYLFPIKFVIPVFLFNQMLSAFLRNDNDPSLATKAVLCGGIFNIFGDYFFVFVVDWGIMGAGFATAIGSLFTLIIMLTHFLKSNNTLQLVKVSDLCSKFKSIITTGFSTFFIDVSMGVLTIIFNRQILKYQSIDALSVYGIIINISTFVQCCAYSIGQAAQPIISVNYGAKRNDRINESLKYSIWTAILFGMIWTLLSMLMPNVFVNIFMTPTEKILQIAPNIIRKYSISFLILPINIFSTYYFQAIMKPNTSFIVSVGRGAVISGILIYILPLIFGADSIWYAMLMTELIIMLYVVAMIKHYQKSFN